ncbi:uncharacterized protein [Amphiura filiformis]|uniref:uncharacterized protein isoform X2 n=1 Tax=Amphiura filiformis TaxID=82378 RepID=UPI003B21255E
MCLQNHFSLLILITVCICGVNAYDCPQPDYSFRSCPRAEDRPEDTICCTINGIQQCCSEDTLTAWAIALLVIGILVVLGIIIAFILCCCGLCNACITCCKPKRREYVVIAEPTQAYTTTTIYPSSYGAGPPPPPGYQPPPTDGKPVKPV